MRKNPMRSQASAISRTTFSRCTIEPWVKPEMSIMGTVSGTVISLSLSRGGSVVECCPTKLHAGAHSFPEDECIGAPGDQIELPGNVVGEVSGGRGHDAGHLAVPAAGSA